MAKYTYISARPKFFFIMGFMGLGVAIAVIGYNGLQLIDLNNSVTPLESSVTPSPPPSPVETPEAVETPPERAKTPREISNWAEWENPDHADQPIVDPKP